MGKSRLFGAASWVAVSLLQSTLEADETAKRQGLRAGDFKRQ